MDRARNNGGDDGAEGGVDCSFLFLFYTQVENGVVFSRLQVVQRSSDPIKVRLMCEQAKKEGGGIRVEEEDRHVDCRGRGRMRRGKGLLILFGRLRRTVSKEMSRAEKAGRGMGRHKDGFIAEYIAKGGGGPACITPWRGLSVQRTSEVAIGPLGRGEREPR